MRRLRNLFRARNLQRELAHEMASHFDEKIDELIESGMSREEAVFAAKQRFGNTTLLLEQGHEVWRLSPIEKSGSRFALRGEVTREKPAVHRDGCSDSGARNWRKLRDVQFD
jgi:uncharacterized protein YoaH (UPF0181 family)